MEKCLQDEKKYRFATTFNASGYTPSLFNSPELDVLLLRALAKQDCPIKEIQICDDPSLSILAWDEYKDVLQEAIECFGLKNTSIRSVIVNGYTEALLKILPDLITEKITDVTVCIDVDGGYANDLSEQYR